MKGLFSSNSFFPGDIVLQYAGIIESVPDVEIQPDGIGVASEYGALAPGTESQSLMVQREIVCLFTATEVSSGRNVCLKRWQIKPIKIATPGTYGCLGVLKQIHNKVQNIMAVRKEFEIMKASGTSSEYVVQVYDFIASGCFVFLSFEVMAMDLRGFFIQLDKEYDMKRNVYTGAGESLFFGSRLFVLYPLLKALQHLEGLSIVHKDIKPGNILLCATRPYVKLGDFGGAYVMKNPKSRFPGENFISSFAEYGTDFYVSPEVKEDRVCSFGSDIWSLGMTIMLASHDSPQVELYFHGLRWKDNPYSLPKYPICSLFKDVMTFKTITMTSATKLLHDYMFHSIYERGVYTRQGNFLMKEVHHLAARMLQFSLEERPSALQLLCSNINTPSWSCFCEGWEKPDSRSLPSVFELTRRKFLDVLES